MKNLFDGYEWDAAHVTRCYEAIKEINDQELKLDIYPNQFEIVSSEQMLDAYSSTGMPIMYRHWSFGKQFAMEQNRYKKGYMGLALELVINSNPCINYLLEDITATECAAVIAHAAFGHNTFFKNNYLFKQWTDASAIVEYLLFAKKYIEECEERYGFAEVEATLDSVHALQRHGISKYKKPSKISKTKEIERQKEREEYNRSQFNEVWNKTIPKIEQDSELNEDYGWLEEPEENLLYFLEKNSPTLKTWQREIVRIVRKISTYFVPQFLTKIMNEGTATYCHFYLMTRLQEKGLLTDGQYMEFLRMHSGVVYQPSFDNKRYSGFNPYRLGFEIFRDMERITKNPDQEDLDWFPEFAGKGNFLELFKDTIKNYRDESFVRQFLGPKVMRDYGMFRLTTSEQDANYSVSSIHDKQGFKEIRKSLADSYLPDNYFPEIKIVRADLKGNRTLYLQHVSRNNMLLKEAEARKTIHHLQRLWGFDVELEVIGDPSGMIQQVFKAYR